MPRTIEEVAAKIKADNPTLLIGIDKVNDLVAVFADEHWQPVISGTITGHWVYLGNQGLPLVNGERVYSDSDFTAI